jgi:hypothetical protein
LPDITRLTKLETLNVEESWLADQGLREVCQMTHLKKLNIRKLHRMPSDSFKNISKLTKLVRLNIEGLFYMPNDHLTTLLTLTNLEKLEALHLDETDCSISIIGKLTKMTHLSLLVDDEKVTSRGLNLNYLTDLTNLKFLYLYAVKCFSDDDNYLSSFPNLTYLNVRMREENLSVLKNLTAMQDLSIAVPNDINEELLRIAAALPELASLSLQAPRCSVAVDILTRRNLTALDLLYCHSFYGSKNRMDDGM